MRTCLVAIFGLLGFVASLPKLAYSGDNRPNILFVFTDDQTYRSVSCYAGAWSWSQTPQLDRLASEGTRFQNAYSGPWCSPSRAMMMSGRQLHAIERPTTLRKADGIAPIWQPALHRAGYRCGFIGKWDLPPRLEGIWDHSVVWHASGEVRVKFDPMHYYSKTPIEINRDQLTTIDGYATDFFTQHAIDFIKQESDQPWFLWLCLGAPHVPSIPPDRYRDLYASATPELPDLSDMFGPRDDVPFYQRQRSEVTRKGDRIEREFPKGMLMVDLMREYAACVRAIDDAIGKIREALDASGEWDETLIVFTSDDGMPFGEHGFVNKTGPYESCQRVPLIVRSPKAAGCKAGVCQFPVSALDVIPTLLAMADVPPPYPMHGHDLSPLLRDPKADWEHAMLLESFAFEAGAGSHVGITPYELRINRPSPDGIPWWLMLRQGRYKYIRTLVSNEIEEIYDIEQDPKEQNNLAVNPMHRKILDEFRLLLDKTLRATDGAKLADQLPLPIEP